MDRIIPVEIKISASTGDGRFLRFAGRMRHTSSNSITNLRFHPKVTIGGVVVHDGPAGTWVPVGHPVLVGPEGAMDIEIAIPLSTRALERIEFTRSGDLKIEIQGLVEYSIAHPIPNQGHWLAGETRRMALTGDGGMWQIAVPHSEWVKHLNNLEWGLTDLVEISCQPSPDGPAARHLAKARTHFLNGHWDEVLGSAYRAIEACAPKAESSLVGLLPHLNSIASKAANDLCLKAKAFTHAGRHEEGSEPGREDAQFALLVAAAVASLLEPKGRREPAVASATAG
jgi:hypothetical protein